MDISIISIIVFICVLIAHYMFPYGAWGYHPLSLSDIKQNNLDNLANTYYAKQISLALLVAVSALTQFILNVIYLAPDRDWETYNGQLIHI